MDIKCENVSWLPSSKINYEANIPAYPPIVMTVFWEARRGYEKMARANTCKISGAILETIKF